MANFKKPLKKIGVYTSGGDAPGMNAAIRAVTRVAYAAQIEVVGILGGYQGLLQNQFRPLLPRDMANIIQRGGTILKTGRCLDFHKSEIREAAARNIRNAGIDALVCLGGDGSFRGAHALWLEHQIPITGAPCTIDNDIHGTDRTIGFDTAVNTALQAIDKIRDTADSHDRVFIVEVMGRNSGFIASAVGLAGGAEEIFSPEGNTSVEKAAERIKQSIQRGKKSSIIIAAEGQKPGRAYDLADSLRKKTGLDAKVCILGHQQRGGAPTASDRILASQLSAAAVEALKKGECDIMLGVDGSRTVQVPFEITIQTDKKMSLETIHLANLLSL